MELDISLHTNCFKLNILESFSKKPLKISHEKINIQFNISIILVILIIQNGFYLKFINIYVLYKYLNILLKIEFFFFSKYVFK